MSSKLIPAVLFSVVIARIVYFALGYVSVHFLATLTR
jgi:hypothetical protein